MVWDNKNVNFVEFLMFIGFDSVTEFIMSISVLISKRYADSFVGEHN